MIKAQLQNAITEALRECDLPEVAFTVERPNEAGRGDYASNAAFLCAKEVGESPQVCAERIIAALSHSSEGAHVIAHAACAGPGFINITVSDAAIYETVQAFPETLSYGVNVRGGTSVNIEFISANPTGALHIGHGRGAFYGDALARILTFAGARVDREYFINDSRESSQIKELGRTALGKGDTYRTDRVDTLIDGLEVSGLNEADAGFLLACRIQEENRRFITDTLGIDFDIWYSEDENIRATNATDVVLSTLNSAALTYEADGALWVRSSAYGDEDDRVLVRADGTGSYFLSDIAYHNDKFDRCYDEVINIWGADHHGHVKRMQAVKNMLGWEAAFHIFITQLIGIQESGAHKKMSKREGTVVLLSDLVEEFGIDVVRWFFLEKAVTTHMDFDVDRAKEQSDKNPVYSVQYAHARMRSIERKCAGLVPDDRSLTEVLEHPSGRALAMKLIAFPDTIEVIATDYQVHRLTTYVHELASTFSQFYRDVRVIEGDTYHAGAYVLLEETRVMIARCLELLGIHAPEEM